MLRAPLIIAHRGLSGQAPENTVAAFKHAWSQGADGIEFDVRVSSDHHLVVYHDAVAVDADGRELPVAGTPYVKLRQLGSGPVEERIARLSDVLATVPRGGEAYLEIKTGPEILEPLVRAIEASSLVTLQLAVLCFDARILAALKQMRRRWRTCWLVAVPDNWMGRPKIKVGELLETARKAKVDGLALEANPHLSAAHIEPLRKAGLEVNLWTVNDPEEARRLAAFGVTSLTTDDPAGLKAAF